MSLGEAKLDCKACSEVMKIDRGCIKDSPIPGRWNFGEFQSNRCPLAVIDKNVFGFLRAYSFLEKGVLPNSGGWLDQANKFIEAMDYIANELNKASPKGKNGQ